MSLVEIPQTRQLSRTKATVEPEEADDLGMIGSLLSMSKTVRALMGVRLAEIGFHNGQDEALLILDRDTSIAVSDLSDKLNVRPSTISKMMDRLTAKGLVVRLAHKDDARRTMLQLTRAGVNARDEIVRLHAAIEADLVASLKVDDPSALTDALETIQTCLARRLMRLR